MEIENPNPNPNANRNLIALALADAYQAFKTRRMALPPTWKKYFITALMATNIIYFVVVVVLNWGWMYVLFGSPAKITGRVGGVTSEFLDGCKFWQPFTFIFMHAGIVNLIPNLLSVVILIVFLEEHYYFLEILMYYAFSAILTGIYASRLFPGKILTGGSVACCGLIGSYIAVIISKWPVLQGMKRTAITVVLGSIVLQLIMGCNTNVFLLGSFGGMFFGLLLGLFAFNVPYFRIYRHLRPARIQLGRAPEAPGDPREDKWRLCIFSWDAWLLLLVICVGVFFMTLMDCTGGKDTPPPPYDL